MAKYILAASTDRPIGKVGGAVFTRNGTTFVIRKRNAPVQKRTQAQTHAKNC